MAHFLLIYDRSAGKLLRKERFESNQDALAARFAAERESHRGQELEIVVISAESESDLHRSHGRYFMTPEELAKRLVSA
jgi:hypothetical protein